MKGNDSCGNGNWLLILLYANYCGYCQFYIVNETNCRYYNLVRKEMIKNEI